MSLEFLRRVGREYDHYIIAQAQRQRQLQDTTLAPDSHSERSGGSTKGAAMRIGNGPTTNARKFRPGVSQQCVRALIHMLQFGVAYIVMLLAMYYNGYIFFCIIIGAGLGAFVFSWEPIDLG
jgi:copper transporter 1